MIEVEQKAVLVRSLSHLDALVAEYVMLMPRHEIYYLVEGQELITTKLPWYSDSIEDAWQVVEKLEHFTPVVEGLTQTGQQSAKWRCLFANISKLGLNNGWHLSDSSTAPIAICLAALKTVGIEVKLELTDAK